MILIADIEFILILTKEGFFSNIIIYGRDDDKKFKEMGFNKTYSEKGNVITAYRIRRFSEIKAVYKINYETV